MSEVVVPEKSKTAKWTAGEKTIAMLAFISAIFVTMSLFYFIVCFFPMINYGGSTDEAQSTFLLRAASVSTFAGFAYFMTLWTLFSIVTYKK